MPITVLPNKQSAADLAEIKAGVTSLNTTLLQGLAAPGQILPFADAALIPSNYDQVAGASAFVPTPLMTGIWGIKAPADPYSLGSGTGYACEASDGLHVFNFSGPTTLTSHVVLDESSGTWPGKGGISNAYPSTLIAYPACIPISDGTFALVGGATSSADITTTYKWLVSSSAFTSIKPVPAGGWSGGGSGIQADGKTLWVPSHKRSGSSMVANTDTWLTYDPSINDWTVFTAANSVPANYSASYPYASTSNYTGGAPWVKLPSGTKFGAISATAGMWFVIDAVNHTITEKARPGPSSVSSATGTPSYLVPTTYGVYLIPSAGSTFQSYVETADTWSAVLGYLNQSPSVGTVSTNGYYRARGYKLLSGLYYLGGSGNQQSTALFTGTYKPAGIVYASKHSS